MFLRMNRRGYLGAALASALAYVGYHVAAYNNVIIVTHNRRAVRRGRIPRVRSDDAKISLLVVGDTGLASPQRQLVVQAMEKQAAAFKLDSVMLAGDNFYESGVKSTDDPKFQTDFEEVFQMSVFACPFYACLGNHDYSGNVQAQVEYSGQSDRWKMPARYFKRRFTAQQQSIDLFVIDTIPIDLEQPDSEAQLRWLDEQMSSSDAQWKIVMGHHPCISGGRHGASDAMARRLAPILTRNKIDLYVSGHDHDLQLIDSQQGWLQVVSGAGSKIRSTNWISQAHFAAAEPGFAWILVQNGTLWISFFGIDDHLYTHQVGSKAPAKNRDLQTSFAA